MERYHIFDDPNWSRRSEVAYLPDAERSDLQAWLMEQAWRYADSLIGNPCRAVVNESRH